MVWNQTAILMVKKSPGTLNNHSWMATFQLDGSKSLLGILFHQTSIHKKLLVESTIPPYDVAPEISACAF